MAAATFIITEENPNDALSGGCLCSPEKVTDCTGPFAVFYATDMDNPVSPHQVLGCKCARALGHALNVKEEMEAKEAVPYTPPLPEPPTERAPEPEVLDEPEPEYPVPEVLVVTPETMDQYPPFSEDVPDL